MPDEETRLDGVRRLRGWLDQNKPLYNEMRKRLNNPAKVRNMLRNLKAACENILAYSPANEPHVAVFVIARAQTELEGFFKDLDFVDHYEVKMQEMKELKGTQHADSDEDGELTADPKSSG